jgi:hypothetical protein
MVTVWLQSVSWRENETRGEGLLICGEMTHLIGLPLSSPVTTRVKIPVVSFRLAQEPARPFFLLPQLYGVVPSVHGRLMPRRNPNEVRERTPEHLPSTGVNTPETIFPTSSGVNRKVPEPDMCPPSSPRLNLHVARQPPRMMNDIEYGLDK